MIGTRVAGYQILEKLGEGGMGVVYKAVDLSLDRVVALKALTAELAKNPELEQRFRAEARAQASLNHVNLATLYAFLVESGSAWMVMEFIEGETFAGMIQRRGPIPSRRRSAVPPGAAGARLRAPHGHRASRHQARQHHAEPPGHRQGDGFRHRQGAGQSQHDAYGHQMGTAWYMAPEQVMNRGVDIRSDIYALGVTLYEMLSGRVPFESDSDYQVMTDHVNTPPPPPTQFYPYIPQGVANAVLKALDKDPNERFQTTEEFGAALENPGEPGWVPGAVAVPGMAAVAPVAAGPVHAAMGNTAPLTQPGFVAPPPPAGFSWTVPRLALLGLGLVILAGAAVFLKVHSFGPKPTGGLVGAHYRKRQLL
jgi:hypothetical protein